MQIMIFAILLIGFIAFVLYKINHQFKLKEMLILLFIIVISITIGNLTLRNISQKVPNIFKQKYEKRKNAIIIEFSYEKINTNISSNTNFIYNFTYIISKGNKQFICNAKNVRIKKIQNEYVIKNFNNLDEKCKEN